MSCTFKWYNLPAKIKEETGLVVKWKNLPTQLNAIYKTLAAQKPICASTITYEEFKWFSLPYKIGIICDLLDCVEPVPLDYNFDVTADWIGTGIENEVNFVSFLDNSLFDFGNNLTNIVITDFSLVNGRLRCNLTADGDTLSFTDLNANAPYGSLSVSDLEGIGNLSQLTALYLDSNQIVTFNPTIALPSSLTTLSLYNNQIVTFNPTIALPSSLTYLALGYNQMTLAGYAASESWANVQPAFINNCYIYFNENINSVSGSNLETILITKNCNVIA